MDSKTEKTESPVLGGIMVCHPPLIVPAVGKGEEKEISEITEAYEKAAQEIVDMHPDTVVIVSPHAPSYLDYIQLTSAPVSCGSLTQFGDQKDFFTVHNDLELVREMEKIAEEQEFAMGTLGRQNEPLDHGTVVPLYFLQNLSEDTKIVRMSIGGLSNLDHYKAGQILAAAAKKLGRKVAVVASGDLSHCQKEGSSYGFKACGPIYDAKIMDIMSNGDFVSLVEMPEKEADDAMSCGHKPFCVMAGAMDGFKPESKGLAHSAEFGVGYGICTYTDLQKDENRHLYDMIEKDLEKRRSEARAKEDEYVKLARRTIENYIRKGIVEPLPGDLSEELRKDKAGVFVSIHEFGGLRGCIGTTAPTQKNIAMEIVNNAISASTRDPRFSPIRPEELKDLEINVDVLTPSTVCSIDDLDPKKYGVIVSSKGRRGLLLPDLEGVDSVEQQIRIAKQKAGILEDEQDIELERFEVVRHV